MAWRPIGSRTGLAVYPGQTLFDEEMSQIMAVVGFYEGVIANQRGASRRLGIAGVNREGL